MQHLGCLISLTLDDDRHARFGFLYDEYSTYRSSLIMQFSILIGDETPDYSTDPLMCIYLVSFVFVCTLSLLNFMLAIVVSTMLTCQQGLQTLAQPA